MHFRQFALGLAAALMVASTVHAEDAVVPDEFDQQQAMGACDAYGTGYAKLPGTNTCVKVGRSGMRSIFRVPTAADGSSWISKPAAIDPCQALIVHT
jgi:hypothetical protein